MNGASSIHFRCRLCGGTAGEVVADITARPAGETDYHIHPGTYHRQVVRCSACSVYNNVHTYVGDDFYAGFYNQASYGERLKSRYAFIRGLPVEKSDNKQRAARLDAAMRSAGRTPASSHVLDVGMGLCVFLAEMKDLGYRCHGVDPDPRSVEHAKQLVGIESAQVGMAESFVPVRLFDLITFNKVLEHVADPVAALSRAPAFLADGGRIYIELPDGDGASVAGGFVDRQEFYVEHLTVWGRTSLLALAVRCGLKAIQIDCIHEPSGKYSVYGLFVKA